MIVKISNEQIYARLGKMDTKLERMNGRIVLNRWIGGTALLLVMMAYTII